VLGTVAALLVVGVCVVLEAAQAIDAEPAVPFTATTLLAVVQVVARSATEKTGRIPNVDEGGASGHSLLY